MIARALIAGIVLAAGPAAAREVTRNGLCEASAAAILPDGRLVVASDEMDHLAVYDSTGLEPRWSEDVGSVDDIEGAARIGDTVFWVTSHGYKKDPDKRKQRRKLFATRIGADGLPDEVGKKYRDLARSLGDALDDSGIGVHGDRFERDLEIEGLASTPDGALLIGIRAPLTTAKAKKKRRAIVVLLPRPFALLNLPQPDAGPTETKVFPLDLDGLGIRAITRDPGGTYVIVAGRSNGGRKTFALYTWRIGETPSKVTRIDHSAFQPEAVVVRRTGRAEVLSDNEDGCKGKDKDGPPGTERSFPSRLIEYGAGP